jgi:hypothetical protein
MRSSLSTPIVLAALITACGSHAPTAGPATPRAAAPPHASSQSQAAPAPTPPPAAPVDVHARCAELAKPSDVAIPAARALGDATEDVDEAVDCLADALINAPRNLWGTEQAIEFEQLRDALAASVQSLTGIAISGFDPDDDADANALASQARSWISHH